MSSSEEGEKVRDDGRERKQTFEFELPIKALFDSSTVADMALVISQKQTEMAAGEKLERVLAELESMSEEKAKELLARKNRPEHSRQI